jgi:spoIIIJ-associated protein
MSGMERVQETIGELLSHAGVSYRTIYVRKSPIGKSLVFDVVGGSARELVRSGGDVLYALTTLARAIAEREGGIDTDFSIDIEGAEQRRIETLQEKARRAAERVIETGKPFELPPMNAFDRKIVHDTLADKAVTTKSIGENKNRRIVVNVKVE